MSTVAELPASAKILTNPRGNGGLTGGADPINREEVVKWKCDWADAAAFIDTIIGSPQSVVVSGVTVTRVVPLQSPYTSFLYANSYSFECVGSKGTNAAKPYNYVIFTVTFAYPTRGTGGSDSPYFSISEQASVRSVTVPNTRYVFSNGQVLDHGIALTFPGVSYVFTIYQVSDINAFRSNAYAMLAAPVNSSTLTLGGISIPAGNALFESYSTESTITNLGVEQHSASIIINVSSLPWNRFIRNDGTQDDLTPAPYLTSNLNGLIV